MSAVRLFRASVIALLAGSALAISASAQVELVERCSMAEQFLDLGQLTLARKAFLAVLNEEPESDCARRGYETTTERQRRAAVMLAVGRDAATLGTPRDLAAARSSYVEALALDASLEGAVTDALAALETPPDDAQRPSGDGNPYAAAEKMFELGYEEEARKLAREVLEANPDIDPSGDVDFGPSRVSRLTGIVESAGSIVAAVVAAWALLWVTWKLLIKLVSHWPTNRKAQIVLGDFVDNTTESKLGADLKARIADELDLASSSAKRMTKVEGTGTQIDIVESLPSKVQLIGPLLSWLQKKLQYHVTGTLHRPYDGTFALSLSIIYAGDRIVASQRFEFSGVQTGKENEACLALAVDAAAWTLFAFQHLRQPWRPVDSLHVMGARSWRSYSLYRQGVLAGGAAGTRLFHQALADDHRNVAALISLGFDQTEDVERENEYQAGIEHLELARELIDADQWIADRRVINGDDAKRGRILALAEDDATRERIACTPVQRLRPVLGKLAKSGTRVDPLWYQAAYKAAVAYLHRYAYHEDKSGNDSKEPPPDLLEGVRTAAELARAIGASMVTLRNPLRRWAAIRGADRRTLRLMLDHDAGYLLGMFAGSLASLEWRDNDGKLVPPPEESKNFWSWLAALNPNSIDIPAIAVLGGLDALADYSTADMQYNLACFYARARDSEASLSRLRKSFEHRRGTDLGASVGWAMQDPTLIPLRDGAESRFNRLIAEFQALATYSTVAPNDHPPDEWIREIPAPEGGGA